MKSVSLEADGAFAKVVDDHEGRTGGDHKDNAFTVTIPDNKDKKVILRAMVVVILLAGLRFFVNSRSLFLDDIKAYLLTQVGFCVTQDTGYLQIHIT